MRLTSISNTDYPQHYSTCLTSSSGANDFEMLLHSSAYLTSCSGAKDMEQHSSLFVTSATPY